MKGGACGTKRNSHALYKKRFRLDVAKYSFSNRVINELNRLPNKVITAMNVNAFKGKLVG